MSQHTVKAQLALVPDTGLQDVSYCVNFFSCAEFFALFEISNEMGLIGEDDFSCSRLEIFLPFADILGAIILCINALALPLASKEVSCVGRLSLFIFVKALIAVLVFFPVAFVDLMRVENLAPVASLFASVEIALVDSRALSIVVFHEDDSFSVGFDTVAINDIVFPF